jgi:anti-sigma-K factor RskA
MSDVSPDCPTVESLAPELALGILSGSERATALAHLGHCATCRRLVDELATVADPILLLAPEAEPSIGFESRVLAATTAADRSRPVPLRRKRRRASFLRVAAAAAVVMVAAASGVVAGRVLGGDDQLVRTAVAVTANGRSTCRAFAYGEDQAWVFVSLHAPREWTADYTVEITTEGGGRAASVGHLRLQGGEGALGTVVDVPASRLRAVRVLDPSGALRYEAPFERS